MPVVVEEKPKFGIDINKLLGKQPEPPEPPVEKAPKFGININGMFGKP